MGPPPMIAFGSLLTLLICGTVLALGRTPERAAAALVLGGLGLSLALQAALGFQRQLPVLLADIGLTAGFIGLAYRFRRVWLAVISLLLIVLLVVHAALSETPFRTPLFVVLVDGLNLAGLAVLAGGAVAEARGRRPRASPR